MWSSRTSFPGVCISIHKQRKSIYPQSGNLGPGPHVPVLEPGCLRHQPRGGSSDHGSTQPFVKLKPNRRTHRNKLGRHQNFQNRRCFCPQLTPLYAPEPLTQTSNPPLSPSDMTYLHELKKLCWGRKHPDVRTGDSKLGNQVSDPLEPVHALGTQTARWGGDLGDGWGQQRSQQQPW